MKKLTKEQLDERLSISSEKTGYIYSFTDDPTIFSVFCPKHNFTKLQNRTYVFQARKINCCNSLAPLTPQDMENTIKEYQNDDHILSVEGEFNGGETKIKVYCKIHDHTRIITLVSLRAKKTEFACNKCSHEKYNRNFAYNKEEWIKRAKKVHGDTYDYSEMEDTGLHRTIICKKHGKFQQNIHNHVYLANGCPKCVIVPNVSQPEHNLNDIFTSWGFVENIDYIRNDKSLLFPKELDFYFPKLQIGIEFNGDFWHSDIKKNEKYHQQKCLDGKSKNVNVIMIYQHLWNTKKDIIINRLKHILQKSEKIYARKTTVKEVSFLDAKDFCEKYHIQGMSSSTSHSFGLYYNNILVSVMTFGKSRFTSHEVELIRLCSSCSVVGGASKLLKAFIRKYSPTSIISYADLDWSNGNVYEKLGFIFEKITSPSYVWVKGNIIKSRYQTQMKNENEIMKKDGFLKIYKSGSIRYSMFCN
jgi:phage FluMu protein Com